MRVFAGQRDEGFYVDLGIFDLLGVGAGQVEDSTAGFNVSTLAIQVPSRRADARRLDAERRRAIPTPSSACGRRRAAVRRATLRAGAQITYSGALVQVSRLGNPLVNEAVIDLARKDAFNGIEPTRDAVALDRVTDPEVPKLLKPDLRRRVAAGAAQRSGDDLPDRHPRPEPAGRTCGRPRCCASTWRIPPSRRLAGYDRMGVLGGDLGRLPERPPRRRRRARHRAAGRRRRDAADAGVQHVAEQPARRRRRRQRRAVPDRRSRTWAFPTPATGNAYTTPEWHRTTPES